MKGGDVLKIDIQVDEKATELSISITCNHLTPEIEKLLATLRMMNRQLAVKKNEDIYLLDVEEAMYIESIDRKCFVYTQKDTYESNFKRHISIIKSFLIFF